MNAKESISATEPRSGAGAASPADPHSVAAKATQFIAAATRSKHLNMALPAIAAGREIPRREALTGSSLSDLHVPDAGPSLVLFHDVVTGDRITLEPEQSSRPDPAVTGI